MLGKNFRSARRALPGLLGLVLSACYASPEAPEEYEELMSFMFENMEAEEEVLIAGLDNLGTWVEDSENLGKTLSGFLLNEGLTENAVDSLDDEDRKGTGLNGMSFAVKSPHHVSDLTKTLAWADFEKALPHLESYERTFIPEDVDPTCLARKECTFLEAQTRVRADWGGLGIMETRERVQFRVVETDGGPVLLHRTWMIETAKLDNALFDVTIRESFKITVNLLSGGAAGAQLPKGVSRIAGSLNGGGQAAMEQLQDTLCGEGTLRIEARWMDANFSALSDEDALDISMGTAKKDATNLDTFMSERFEEVTPEAPLLYGEATGCDSEEIDTPGTETPVVVEGTLEGLAPCPAEESPCEVTQPEAFGEGVLFTTIAVSANSDKDHGFNVDPEQGEEDCAPKDACFDGVDNSLNFLGSIANTGLSNAIADGNLALMAEWSAGEGEEGVVHLYTGTPVNNECSWAEALCEYTPDITSWGCDCALLATLPGIKTDGSLEAGGDSSSFVLQIPIEGAMLSVPIQRARLKATLTGDGLSFESGLMGGAVRIDELTSALADFPLDPIGPLPKDSVIQIIETLPADVDTDEDGEDDALSIGIQIQGSPVTLSWTLHADTE